MKNYRITFVGRTKGAIGIFYRISAIRTAKDQELALASLYDDYEHISCPTFEEINGGNNA